MPHDSYKKVTQKIETVKSFTCLNKKIKTFLKFKSTKLFVKSFIIILFDEHLSSDVFTNLLKVSVVSILPIKNFGFHSSSMNW